MQTLAMPRRFQRSAIALAVSPKRAQSQDLELGARCLGASFCPTMKLKRKTSPEVRCNSCKAMWDLIGIHQRHTPHLNIAEALHRQFAITAGKMSSAHLIRDLLPAYLDDGLCLSGTYLDTLISRSTQSGNIPYAWVCLMLLPSSSRPCKQAGLQGSQRL